MHVVKQEDEKKSGGFSTHRLFGAGGQIPGEVGLSGPWFEGGKEATGGLWKAPNSFQKHCECLWQTTRATDFQQIALE